MFPASNWLSGAIKADQGKEPQALPLCSPLPLTPCTAMAPADLPFLPPHCLFSACPLREAFFTTLSTRLEAPGWSFI